MKLIKFLKLNFLIFFSLQMALTISLVAQPKLSAAQEDPASLQFTPQISIPGGNLSGDVGSYDKKTGRMNSDLLAKYIQAIYNYGMGIVGILAAVVLMGGGIVWLTSGGSAEKVGQAKELIFGSIIGMVLLLGSWIILNTVNPDLLKLKTISLQVVQRIDLVCCEYDDHAGMASKDLCEKDGGKSYPPIKDLMSGVETAYGIDASGNKCEIAGCCISKNSQGPVSCANTMRANCNDANNFKDGRNCRLGVGFIGEDCPIVDQCDKVENGEDCFDKSGYGNNYCYNKICWKTNNGQLGEPCGNELYSKCDKDEPQNGKTCNGDMGGRSCGAGLSCCKFDSRGSRINK